jgi:hypothetical protein
MINNSKKALLQFLLNSLFILGLIFHYSQNNIVLFAAPEISPQIDTRTFTIVKGDFGFPNSGSNILFNFNKGSGNETFWYEGWANQTSSLASNPWFNIKAHSTARFTQPSEVGSSLNQWRLVSLTLNYAKQGDVRGQTNWVYLDNIFMFDFVVNTNEISKSVLDANAASFTKNFTYAQNIKTFSIVPREDLYLSSMIIEYQIDYSNC